MATRVNYRFLLILFIAVSIGVGVIGTVAYLAYSRDADRFIRNGDAALAEGDFAKAYEWYGKAVSKQPNNLEFLAKAEDAIRRIVPRTSVEATQRFNGLIAILRQRSTSYADDPKMHLPLVQEFWNTARLQQTSNSWGALAEVGKAMYDRVPATEPLRNVGLLFQSIATLQRGGNDDAALDAAEENLRKAVDGLPADHELRDLGMGMLALLQRARSDRMELAGQQAPSEAKRKQAEATLAEAVREYPNGVTVRKAALVLSTIDRDPVEGGFANDPKVAADMDSLCELALSSPDGIAVAEVASTVANVDRSYGAERARSLLQDYLAKHPHALYHQALLAQILLQGGKHEDAMAVSNKILEAPNVPVSLEAVIQDELRVNAAAMKVRVAFDQWNRAKEDQRATFASEVQSAVDSLKKITPDLDSSPAGLEAAGKLAVVRKEYAKAASKFDRIIETSGQATPEMYYLSAVCAEKVNAIGQALKRITEACNMMPGDIELSSLRASYLLLNGRRDEARALAEDIHNIDEKNERANAILEVTRIDNAGDVNDINKAIVDSRQALTTDDRESAIPILMQALQRFPDNLPLLANLAGAQAFLGNIDESNKTIDKALSLQPGGDMKATLVAMKAANSTDDRIERIRMMAEATQEDENDRPAAVYMQLSNYRDQLKATVENASDDAKKADAEKELARTEQAVAEAKAKALAVNPNHTMVLETDFRQAIRAGDWTAANDIVDRAAKADADQVGGLLFKARMEFARGELNGALTTLRNARAATSITGTIDRFMGIIYRQLGNIDEALASMQRAIESDPTNITTVALYSEMLIQAGRKTEALEVLSNAMQANPGNIELAHRTYLLEAEVGDRRRALEGRRLIFKESPNHRENAVQLAQLYVSTPPDERQVNDELEKGAIKIRGKTVAAKEWSKMSTSDQQEVFRAVQDSWIKQAEKIIEDLLAANPKDLELVRTKASMLTERGQSENAEALLQKLIDDTAEGERTSEMYLALGIQKLVDNKVAEAESAFETAVALQDPQKRDADNLLANLYMSRQNYPKALPYLVDAISAVPSRELCLQASEASLKLKKFDDARKFLDQARQSEVGAPLDQVVVELLIAGIAEGQALEALSKNDKEGAQAAFFEQRQAIERAKQAAPGNPLPFVSDASRLLDEYKRTGNKTLLDDAMRLVEQALQKRVDYPQAVAVKVNLLRARGDLASAISEMERFVKVMPRFDSARRDLISLLLQNQNKTRAIEVAKEGITANPNDPSWQTSTGQLLGSAGRIDEATSYFESAYAMSPSAGTLASLVEAYLSKSPPAFAKAKERLESSSEYVDNAPYLQGAYGAVLANTDERPKALEMLKKSFIGTRNPRENANRLVLVSSWFKFASMADKPEQVHGLLNQLTGNKPDAFELFSLAGIYRNTGKDGMNKAVDLYKQAVATAPAEDRALLAAANLELGNTLIGLGQMAASADALEACLKVDPNQLDANNNLAFLCATQLNDPKRGRPFAEKAVELNPQSPDAQDTLGYILTQLGEYEAAETHLRRAIDLNGGAESYYHLAQLMIKTDRREQARNYGLQGLQKNPLPQMKQQIEAMLKTL